MKKCFYLALPLLIAAASCSKSEMIEAPNAYKEISFSTYIGKAPETKGQSVDLAYLQGEGRGFHVKGFFHNSTALPTIADDANPYMDKAVFWVPASGSDQAHWDYDGVVYWPDASSANYLAFTAFGVHTVEATEENGKTVHTSTDPEGVYNLDSNSFDFEVNSTVAEQQDLIVAPFQYGMKIDATSMANTTVTFTFKHVLSRVGFKVQANNENDTDVIITKVDLKGNFHTTGNVNLTLETPAIAQTGSASAQTYSLLPGTNAFLCNSSTTAQPIYNNATGVVAEGDTKYTVTALTENLESNLANRYMMLMPTADGAGNYQLEVEYQLEGTKKYYTATAELAQNFEFNPGKSYEFIFKVSTTSIGFRVIVSEWSNYFPVEGEDQDGNSIVVEDGEFTLTPIV